MVNWTCFLISHSRYISRLAAREVSLDSALLASRDVDAYYGFDGEIQTSHGHYHLVEIRPQVGGRFGVRVDRMQDRPTSDFVVYRGPDGEEVVIAPGLYTWNEWTLHYFGNPSATLYFNRIYTWGSFYDGDSNRFDVPANVRLGAKLQASGGETTSHCRAETSSSIRFPFGSTTRSRP